MRFETYLIVVDNKYVGKILVDRGSEMLTPVLIMLILDRLSGISFNVMIGCLFEVIISA